MTTADDGRVDPEGNTPCGGICRIPLNARIMGVDENGVSHRRLYWTTPKRGVLCDKAEDQRLIGLIERTPSKALTIVYNKYGRP